MNALLGGVFDPVSCLRQSRIALLLLPALCFCKNCEKELFLQYIVNPKEKPQYFNKKQNTLFEKKRKM